MRRKQAFCLSKGVNYWSLLHTHHKQYGGSPTVKGTQKTLTLPSEDSVIRVGRYSERDDRVREQQIGRFWRSVLVAQLEKVSNLSDYLSETKNLNTISAFIVTTYRCYL